MKIIVTGSLGNVSQPLTRELVRKGHSVTVISSKTERQKEIEALGAKAAIGTLEDAVPKLISGSRCRDFYFSTSFEPQESVRLINNVS